MGRRVFAALIVVSTATMLITACSGDQSVAPDSTVRDGAPAWFVVGGGNAAAAGADLVVGSGDIRLDEPPALRRPDGEWLDLRTFPVDGNFSPWSRLGDTVLAA